MSDRDPRSSFVTESALPTWGVPCSLPVSQHLPEPSDRLRRPVSFSLAEITLLGPLRSRLGRRRATCVQLHLVSCARHVVVVGHAQATSRLTRRCSVGQGVSHRSGRVPSYPIRIEWGKAEGFSPPSFRLSPIAAPLPTVVPLSLSRGRERASVLFLRLFLICRLFSFFLFAQSV